MLKLESGHTISSAEVLALCTVDTSSRVFALGLYDTKVTIYAQQLRGYNLAWALMTSGKISENTRIAIVGGGAAGIALSAGLTTARPKRIALFEREHHLMPLQMNNKTRFIQPNIYEWPEQPNSKTDALPDLQWASDYAGNIRQTIVQRFASYESEVDVRLGTRVIGWQEQARQVSLRTAKKGRARITELFDLLILCVGFGVEYERSGRRTLSYWSNDLHDQALKGRYLVFGSGDGGLTDVMRLAIHDLDHRQLLFLFQHDREAIKVARELECKLRVLADQRTSGLLSEEEYARGHDRIFAESPIVPHLKKDLESHRRQGVSVKLTARQHFYGSNASTLNKLIVRHLEAIDAVRWCPPEEQDQELRSARPIYRIGAKRTSRELASDRPAAFNARLGRRLGTDRLFPSGFFIVRHQIKEVRIHVISAQAGDPRKGDHGVGSASMETLSHIRTELEGWCRQRGNVELRWSTRTFVPVMEQRGEILRYLEDVRKRADLLLVLGSDIAVPLFGDGLADVDEVVIRFGDKPIVFFGALPVADLESFVQRNIFVARQNFDLANICQCVQAGFPGRDLHYVYSRRYPVDEEFFRRMQQIVETAKATDPTFFRLCRFEIDEDSFSVEQLPKGHLYAGRYLAHHLAFERDVMRQRAFLSSFATDLDQGAVVAVDSDARHCAREIAHQLIVPLISGSAPPVPLVIVQGDAIIVNDTNARDHGVIVGERLRRMAGVITR